jgi:hypothetical protein
MYSSPAFPRLRLFVTVFLVTHLRWVPVMVAGCAGGVLGNIAGGAARAWNDRRTNSLYQFTSEGMDRHSGSVSERKGGAR